MAKKSRELEAAYVLRDLIAAAITDYQNQFPGYKVILDQEYSMDNPARATIGQLAVEAVDKNGNSKATTYVSL